ncbi:MAG: hypothetical protein Q6370_020540, partial [Candidatus Sigynarchaeota archaeon]
EHELGLIDGLLCLKDDHAARQPVNAKHPEAKHPIPDMRVSRAGWGGERDLSDAKIDSIKAQLGIPRG